MKKAFIFNVASQSLITASLLLVSTQLASADDAVVLDKVMVEGIATPGNGLLTQQHETQAKSVVSRTAIEQKNSQNNVYQAGSINSVAHLELGRILTELETGLR